MELSLTWAAFDRILRLPAILSLVWLAYKVSRYGRREKGLPPGPPTMVGLGNLHQMPTKSAHLKMTEWAREFGEIYSLKIAHQTFIILNGPAAVETLMEKNSRVTAARPNLWLLDKFLYESNHLSFSSDPSTVTLFRRIFTTLLNKTASRKYLPVQEAESCQLVYEIMTTPAGFTTAVKRFTFSQILSVAFGVRSPRWESPWCRKFYENTEILGELVAVGATPPLDIITPLRYLPEVFAPWKRKTRELREEENKYSVELLEVVRERIRSEQKNGAFMEDVVEGQVAMGLTESKLRVLGLLSLQGGADTAACFILSAILLLIGQPEVQARAHKELDSVVGSTRMPTLNDIEKLPYVRAIVKEVERMRPVGPLAVPHRATEDLLYSGYHIPKGSTIILNTWAMGQDPALFADPEKFLPERFLGDDPADDSDRSITWAFGVGRRICPGLHSARNTIHIVLSRLLWAFDIVHATGADGKPIAVNTMDYAEGVQQCPNEFACDFRIRSAAHAETVRNELLEAVPQLELFEMGLSADDAAFVEHQKHSLAI